MKKLAREVAVLLLIGIMLSSSVPRVLADTDLELDAIAIIANTAGELILLRDGAGYEYGVLSTVGEGDIVTVLDGPIAGEDGNYWYEVDVDGLVGFVFADFLVLPQNAPANPVRTKATQRPAPTTNGPTNGYLSVVSGTGGEGARLRDDFGLDAAIALVMPEGAEVEVLGGPRVSDGHSWYPIAYAGETGWIAGDFLGRAGGEQATTASAPVARKIPIFQYGAHATVSGTGDDDLRIRAGSSLDSTIYGYAPPGVVMLILDGPQIDSAGNNWYEVDYDGLWGYASADFLLWTGQALSERRVATLTLTPAPAPVAPAAPPPPVPPASVAPAAPPPPPPPAPKPAPPAPAPPAPAPKPAPAPAPAAADSPASSGNGQALVNAAMRYLGSPYTYAGASPSGFDCSGFTMFVVNRVLGRNIGHGVGGQLAAGRPIAANALQPGDLVFFENTNGPGVTHVGIYIGGGQMIHAGSERTGVVVSNIWDSYWGSKYYAARRL